MNLEHYIKSWILVGIILSFTVAIKAFGFEQRSSYLLRNYEIHTIRNNYSLGNGQRSTYIILY